MKGSVPVDFVVAVIGLTADVLGEREIRVAGVTTVFRTPATFVTVGCCLTIGCWLEGPLCGGVTGDELPATGGTTTAIDGQ